MELKHYRRIIDARKPFLRDLILADIVIILASALLCHFVLKKNIALLTLIVFGVAVVSLSIFYDISINSCYRIFINGENIYIYYPTFSKRAGDEFIFYKIEKLSYVRVSRSSIHFTGRMLVKTEGTKRKNIDNIGDADIFFKDVYNSPDIYAINKQFRVSRIYENEEYLLKLLNSKTAKH